MPTLNPRINVTFPPALDSLLGDLAKVQRVSKSSVVREFIEAVEPQLRQALALMVAAQNAKPNAWKAIGADLRTVIGNAEAAQEVAMAGAAGITSDLVSAAQAIRGRRPARAGAAPTVRGAPVPGARNPPPSNRGVKSGKQGKDRGGKGLHKVGQS